MPDYIPASRGVWILVCCHRQAIFRVQAGSGSWSLCLRLCSSQQAICSLLPSNFQRDSRGESGGGHPSLVLGVPEGLAMQSVAQNQKINLLQAMPIFGGMREDTLDYLLGMTRYVCLPPEEYF